MKINHNNNYLKSLGPSAAETQAMIQAEQNRKKLRTESEASEKIRKFEDTVKQKGIQGPGSNSRQATPEKQSEEETAEKKAETSGSEESGPPPVTKRIDIRI